MSTDLVCVSAEKYPALVIARQGGSLTDNLGPERLSVFDFPRIKRIGPTAQVFKVGDDTSAEHLTELRGIVLWTMPRRVLYEKSFDEDPNALPACSSRDSLTGVGDPGGECDRCPLGVIGGRCRAVRQVLLLREGQVMPEMLTVSPTSLKTVRDWLLKLGRQYTQVVSRWWLAAPTATRSAKSMQVSRIHAETLGVLDDATIHQVRAMANQFREAFDRAPVKEDFTDTQAV